MMCQPSANGAKWADHEGHSSRGAAKGRVQADRSRCEFGGGDVVEKKRGSSAA